MFPGDLVRPHPCSRLGLSALPHPANVEGNPVLYTVSSDEVCLVLAVIPDDREEREYDFTHIMVISGERYGWHYRASFEKVE